MDFNILSTTQGHLRMKQPVNTEKTFYSLIHNTFDTACDLAVCVTAALKICCIAYIELFVLEKNQWLLSPALKVFKEYFHSLLQI